jgi:hypothetical protein
LPSSLSALPPPQSPSLLSQSPHSTRHLFSSVAEQAVTLRSLLSAAPQQHAAPHAATRTGEYLTPPPSLSLSLPLSHSLSGLEACRHSALWPRCESPGAAVLHSPPSLSLRRTNTQPSSPRCRWEARSLLPSPPPSEPCHPAPPPWSERRTACPRLSRPPLSRLGPSPPPPPQPQPLRRASMARCESGWQGCWEAFCGAGRGSASAGFG